MDERMTICNMSIEGGARVRLRQSGPDDVRLPARPRACARRRRLRRGRRVVASSMASGCRTRRYDDEVELDAAAIRPTVTWGINPGPVGVRRRDAAAAGRRPATDRPPSTKRSSSWRLPAGEPIKGTKIDVAFVGSCTNARLSDLREAARVGRGPPRRAARARRSSCRDRRRCALAAEREGLDRVFIEAGFDWRGAGCSMCLAMNPDRLEGREICASSSNRNFKGRQGSPTGRTLLMSPAMVAAAAVAGEVVDVREIAAQWPLSRFVTISGTAPAAARRRHRHRIGSSPRGSCGRSSFEGPREASVRGRPDQADARARDPSDRRIRAYAGSRDPAGERELRLRLVARARRRRRSAGAAFAP